MMPQTARPALPATLDDFEAEAQRVAPESEPAPNRRRAKPSGLRRHAVA